MSLKEQERRNELEEEQLPAVTTLDRHVSVTAGPGAGKTKVLVERYLHILGTQEIELDQIVALTFTNRAANEMSVRVRKRVDAMVRNSTSENQRKWMMYKRSLDSAIITTIHGFSARLLREFPVEAEVDPEFAVLEEHQSTLLLEAATEESVTELIRPQDPVIAALTAGVSRSALVKTLIHLYRDIRNQGLTIDQVSQAAFADRDGTIAYRAAVPELDRLMAEFLITDGLTIAAEKKRKEAKERWPDLLAILSAEPDADSLLDLCNAVTNFRNARPAAQGRLKGLVERLDELIWAKDLKGRIPLLFIDLCSRQFEDRILQALAKIDQRLISEKQRMAALDFDDLQFRALGLLQSHPEVLRRTAARFRFILVDEFQDTNKVQRDLLEQLALSPGQRANVLMVGDRKQSIYGFRGADIDIFRSVARTLEEHGGLPIPLHLNFRSLPPLIAFFNLLFARIFRPPIGVGTEELDQLGYVEHEPSQPKRSGEQLTPIIELLLDEGSREPDGESSESGKYNPREREAAQLATRIQQLVGGEQTPASNEHLSGSQPRYRYCDIALLFRAFSDVAVYESALRRAGVPFITVQGTGLYSREEIRDLIQLLRFLDNQTDEIALAAILRSPLGGLSDNALLALRCAPPADASAERGRLRRRNGVRDLLYALRHHRRIDFIDEEERPLLDGAAVLLARLTERRNRYGIADSLRFAIDASEYRAVAAAHFDGAQRLANLDKLINLAERFERSGAHLIRDFVRFVREFEQAGGRESEGQLDPSIDAVRLMTIHKSKGLEFRLVIIPDLQRQLNVDKSWCLFDRHLGLSLKIPDGAGNKLAGFRFRRLQQRAQWRQDFESMRLLYVAATRARDGLILSGAVDNFEAKIRKRDSWLAWIWEALGLSPDIHSGQLSLAPDVLVRLVVNLLVSTAEGGRERAEPTQVEIEEDIQLAEPFEAAFPLLGSVRPERGHSLHRFSVTQLLNYDRCPRQYYFDRLLHVPGQESLAFWSDAEAPEPTANLTATVRGLVIHRFCEKFQPGDDPAERLKTSLEEVLRLGEADWGNRAEEIDREKAVEDLLPLAENYLGSRVRQRIEAWRDASDTQKPAPGEALRPGVYSERRFLVRRQLGMLSGSIDKLILYPNPENGGFIAEIIDFKTNRFNGIDATRPSVSKAHAAAEDALEPGKNRNRLNAKVERAAADYQLQMQAYALAVHELLPGAKRVKVILHFLDPNIELELPAELLERTVCSAAIDAAMFHLASAWRADDFPVRPEEHCRFCAFLNLCRPGREWIIDHD